MSHADRENIIAEVALQRFTHISCSPADAFKMAEAFISMRASRYHEAEIKDVYIARPVLAAAKEIILASKSVRSCDNHTDCDLVDEQAAIVNHAPPKHSIAIPSMGIAGMAPSEPPFTGHDDCNDECKQAYVHCRKCGALAHGGLCSEPMVIAKVPRPVLAGEARKALCPNCKKPFHLNTPCVP